MTELALISVSSITATHEAGVYVAQITFTRDGEELSGAYGLRPEDDLGLAPTLRQWMADHPDFEIGEYVPPPPAPYRISKTTPWLRMTDAEAGIMEGVMNAAPARLRQIYAAAPYLSSADELWPTLRGMLADQFGGIRADELLAPDA